MSNKNRGITPKTSGLPREILTIFNECYSDFKSTYGEKQCSMYLIILQVGKNLSYICHNTTK